MIQANKPKPLNICTCWDSQCSEALAFGQKIFLALTESKRPLSFWTLLNGSFTSFNWIEDIGIFSLFSKAAFLKTGIMMMFHSGFVGLGCFSLEEKQTHRGITHLPTNLQDIKGKVLSRSGQQLPAALAVLPPGPCPIHLPGIWSLTKDSPGMFDTL